MWINSYFYIVAKIVALAELNSYQTFSPILELPLYPISITSFINASMLYRRIMDTLYLLEWVVLEVMFPRLKQFFVQIQLRRLPSKWYNIFEMPLLK